MIKGIFGKIGRIKDAFLRSPIWVKLGAVLVLGIVIWQLVAVGKSSKTAVQYQTAIVERGSLVASISVSGTVSTANSAQVTTESSGVVRKILVENGAVVKAGDPLAEVDLDLEGKQRNIAAWGSYQSAVNSLYSLQSSMMTKWKTYMDSAQSSTYQNNDGSPKTDFRQLPQFYSTSDDWLAAEAQYKNQQNIITQDYLAYQQASPTIYAPISGTVTGLGLQIGSVITAQSNSSGGSTAQKIASIVTEATPTITVSLTEVDVPKVKIGNATTIAFDSYPGKNYTGKVISIDTVGSVSSGVTTYPAVIRLDTMVGGIFTNMSAQVNIITASKTDVLIVPTGVVTTQNGVSSVRVMKNNQPEMVDVEVGLVSATGQEIVSGLSEGDIVVTAVISNTQSTTPASSSSPFGAFGGSGNRSGFGGSGAIRVQGR